MKALNGPLSNDSSISSHGLHTTHVAVITVWWQDFLTYSQLILVTVAFFVNVATVITLFQNIAVTILILP